jgi:hypothetical protein
MSLLFNKPASDHQGVSPVINYLKILNNILLFFTKKDKVVCSVGIDWHIAIFFVNDAKIILET